ncbi:MAG TPA: hybrid sensor histidine kinase/response regulator, partial [Bradyrhizobium sp.]|nr:hybrid sensor histidine kinase/response regulator [Bradyrhizobium sp.]
MAAKSRGQRMKRGPKKRPAKKRKSAANVIKVHRRTPSSGGVVESALAVFAHEVRTPLTGILA